MTEQQINTYSWSIIEEKLGYERRCYKRSDGTECIDWVYYQYVQFEFIDEKNTVQTIYGYYDDGIAALFTVAPWHLDWNSDVIYDFKAADSPVWRGAIFPADNLHDGDSDFYSWDIAEVLDVIVRLYDINMLRRRVPTCGVLKSAC